MFVVALVLVGYWLTPNTQQELLSDDLMNKDTNFKIDSSSSTKIESSNINESLKSKKEDASDLAEKAEAIQDPKKKNMLKIEKKSLLKVIGATDALAWQEKYELGVFNPAYEESWQDHMFNHAHELILDDRFSQDIEMSKIQCHDNRCDFKLKQVPGTSKSISVVTSKFILALKDHPAILESGQSRNVYIHSIQIKDGEPQVEASIY